MVNPFPGMDPYLEGPEWHSAHVCLCVAVTNQLMPLVRPKYVVRPERRTITVAPDPVEMPRQRFPDVGVIENRPTGTVAGRGAVATPPVTVASPLPHPEELTTVNVYRVEGRRLVTSIEILSPVNKRGTGRREYQAKRKELLASPVNLLEVDLLRLGRRFTGDLDVPNCSYLALLSRAARRDRIELWPIQFDEPLPTVWVPLLPEDGDVTLDLQAALATVYATAGFDDSLDYTHPPRGRLSRRELAWIDGRLRAAGRRD